WGASLEAELTREEHQALALSRGAEVYVSPREMKVFADEERDVVRRTPNVRPKRPFGGPPNPDQVEVCR
ncbi:MAG: hypothetical protein QOD06_3312, partial [Candidatus Binatota bacterium]|nr:hypothetical protein [Candidatus Binatota bacterium]